MDERRGEIAAKESAKGASLGSYCILSLTSKVTPFMASFCFIMTTQRRAAYDRRQ
ncbi:uncharacterized protein M421DRAFT_422291 [Didymella exigua CBS 183.55]|uniref:Uncharacterized protein n=1 Tax=Didymella exigua CBS 183.55 TaxID=1150837 RepID=A0A6A5RNG2_9PLEO|nr:uncharacterized protein M421DRAFT_422291 [Didymella exigua CBS 183.55]KAF1927057.1 hypothetical protein M421DRAFT_422291 [Didymella exigua CBS 183.55]